MLVSFISFEEKLIEELYLGKKYSKDQCQFKNTLHIIDDSEKSWSLCEFNGAVQI